MLHFKPVFMSALLVLAAVSFILSAGCTEKKAEEPAEGEKKAELFMELPETCNTPDGMTLDAETNTIYLSCPNFNIQKEGTPEGTFNNPKYPGIIMKIDADDKLSKFTDMPAHPDTGKAGPMGLDLGPDGNLYVADNQYFFDTNRKSRLVRINITDGKATGADVVVTGFNLSNAVVWYGNHVYVSDTYLDDPVEPNKSTVYGFELSEFKDGPVALKPLGGDPHLLVKITTDPIERRGNEKAGADGMTVDSKGNLYVANFGDGKLHKIALDENGKMKSMEIIINDPKVLSCGDGIFCDHKTDLIYVADSEKNAIHVVTPDGKLTTLCQNGDTDGAGGALDQPCEPLLRGNKLIVANFDMPFPGLINTKFDPPYTLSVITLDK